MKARIPSHREFIINFPDSVDNAKANEGWAKLQQIVEDYKKTHNGASVYALLKKYRPKGIVHCYSGSAEDAEWLAAQGLYFGFGGACTFKGAKRAAKAISALPLERIVLETDCPYMAPEPVRGTRCDSSLIRYVGEYIASVKGLSPEEVFRQTAQNARAVYQL